MRMQSHSILLLAGLSCASAQRALINAIRLREHEKVLLPMITEESARETDEVCAAHACHWPCHAT